MRASYFHDTYSFALADLSIHGARFDEATGIATELAVTINGLEAVNKPFFTRREQVIGSIEDGYHCSVRENRGQRKIWTEKKVSVVEVNGEKYLRIDGLKVSGDYLGKIRHFST